MKKIITLVAALFVMGSVSFAQDSKTAPQKATTSKMSKSTITKTDAKGATTKTTTTKASSSKMAKPAAATK